MNDDWICIEPRQEAVIALLRTADVLRDLDPQPGSEAVPSSGRS